MFAPTAETFRQFLEQQDFFVFIMTIYAGAGLIANDRRANALQIYLSKPLMRTEYIFGKAAVLFAFLLFVTLVPGLLLLLLQVLFAGSFAFFSKNMFLFPAIAIAACCRPGCPHSPCLLCRRSRRAPLRRHPLCGHLFFHAAIYHAMLAITGSTRLSWISLGANSRRWST